MHTLRPTRCGRVEVRTCKVRSCEAVHKLCDQTLNLVSQSYYRARFIITKVSSNPNGGG